MIDGFFGQYAGLGLLLFGGFLSIILIFAIGLSVILRRIWVFSFFMFLASCFFYVNKMTTTAIFYLGLFFVGLVVFFIKKQKNETNIKN